MLNITEVLLGVQATDMRREPRIPAAWQAVGFSEAVIDSRLATPDALFVALRGDRVDKGHVSRASSVLR